MTRSLSRPLARFPLWPLLLGVISGVYLGDHLGLQWWLTSSFVLLLIAALARKLPVSLLGLGIILGYGTHGLIIQNQQVWLNFAHSPGKPSPSLHIQGVIVDTGSRNNGPYLLKVTQIIGPSITTHLPMGTRIVLYDQSPDAEPLQYGDLIEVEGSLEKIAPLRNPYGFDQARWRHRQGADLIMTSYQRVTNNGISTARKPVRTMSRWKLSLREKMTAGLEPDSEPAQLIRAVVLGERPPRSTGMIDDFRNSGTLHVFAVSGLHVGMVGSLIALFFWLSRAPRWLIIILTIMGMMTYAGITGLRPPAVRAVIMATVFLSGFLIQRRPTLINSLAASAIIVLLWDGHQLFTPGFQLSYGVLLAIALLTKFWSNCFQKISQLDPFMPRLLLTAWQERRLSWREKFQAALSVSFAAWVGSTPLMWLHFGIITPIAIAASLPLMMMVFVILGLAMGSMLIGTIWAPAGEKLNQVNALVATVTHNSASRFAHIRGGHLNRHPQRPEHGQIIVFDIPGGGGANLIEIGGGVLLDSGRSKHFHYHVLPTLSYLQVTPDSLIISHADSMHCGAMSRSVELYHPKQAIIPQKGQRSPSYRRFLAKAKTSDCQLITPRLDQTFPLDDSDPSSFLEILHAPAELDGQGLADDSGLVIRLHWQGWRILFTGDAGLITETRLLDSGIDIQADVIVMGRHRDDITGHQAFIKAVKPKAIISSNWDFPEPERIPDDWRKHITAQGITLFDQKLSGAVTLSLNDNQLTLTPMLPTTKPLTLKTSN